MHGTHLPKHVAEARVMFVLIESMYFVALINGVGLCSTVSYDIKVLFRKMYFVRLW